jgi:hypothetical protein
MSGLTSAFLLEAEDEDEDECADEELTRTDLDFARTKKPFETSSPICRDKYKIMSYSPQKLCLDNLLTNTQNCVRYRVVQG